MNLLYEKMRDLVPIQTYLKKRVDNDFLIITSEDGILHYLNEVAKDFYLLVDEKRTIQDITKQLLSEYEVDEIVLQNDVVDLVRGLQWDNLIQLKEEKK